MKPSHLVSALSLLAALSTTVPALAQTSSFGKAGKFVVSAERLTGFFITSGSTDLDGTIGNALQAPFHFESDDSSTTFALLGNGLEAEPAAIPRLGADYFIIDAVSVGGSISYASKSDKSDITTQAGPAITGNREEDVSSSMFALSPRAGYAMMFSDLLGLWGRGGITYTSITSDTEVTEGNNRQDTELSASLVTLAFDAQLLITPVDHVAIGVGPQLDVPLTGSAEVNDPLATTRVDGDVSVLTFGISAGMLVYF